MKAWYFSVESRCLRHEDGRKIETGVTHKVEGELKLCKFGLHGSKQILDALRYAPGPVIWRVVLGGEILKGDDKACATERIYLWGYDATEVLRTFARRVALDVAHLWDCPDVVWQYLQTGDESLRAVARAAVCWAAARDAGWGATKASGSETWAAARDAAGAAAAAGDAARYAARAAAAAGDAAGDAARCATRDHWLEEMIRDGKPGSK